MGAAAPPFCSRSSHTSFSGSAKNARHENGAQKLQFFDFKAVHFGNGDGKDELSWQLITDKNSYAGFKLELYSALHGTNHSKALRHGSHSFNLQRTPCLPLPRKRSPDGAFTACGGEHLIAAHYLFIDPEMMKG